MKRLYFYINQVQGHWTEQIVFVNYSEVIKENLI